jgi:pilus assembly protein Flp/PilA
VLDLKWLGDIYPQVQNGKKGSKTNCKEEKKMGIKNFFKRFIQEEEGATAVEYAVMIVLIIVVCLVAVGLLGNKVNNAFQNMAEAMPDS